MNNTESDKECNCRKKELCPMDGKCQFRNIIYQATVIPEQEGMNKENYIGLTSTTFKARWANHKASLKNRNLESSCKLAQYCWKLNDKNIKYHITWRIICRAKTFSPISNVCNLCINEKYYILYHPEMSSLNSRKELTNNCRHKTSVLLDK